MTQASVRDQAKAGTQTQLAERLLLDVAQGDRSAFRRLYDETSERIYPICLKIVRDREAAADVFQDVYARIWQKAKLFDPAKGSALGWMATIARRCALDRIAETRNDTVSIDDLKIEPAFVVVSRLGGSWESLVLKSCLEQLDAKYAEAIVMAYIYGLTHEEIVHKLSIPLGTVKSRVSRGLALLQKMMADQDEDTKAPTAARHPRTSPMLVVENEEMA